MKQVILYKFAKVPLRKRKPKESNKKYNKQLFVT